MRKRNKEIQELNGSLSSLFSPPEGLRGIFGLLCGLSADEELVDLLLTEFSREKKSIREDLFFILFLDAPLHKRFRLNGIICHYAKDLPTNCKLMHAKVALLAFGKNKDEPTYYRLIVFTGNWTKEAVDNSINLVWFCDLDIRKPNKQNERDIYEAGKFFVKLEKYYKIDLPGKLEERYIKLKRNISRIPKRRKQSRFISNLLSDEPMSELVLEKFKTEIESKRKNFIAFGSGFYEQANSTVFNPADESPDIEAIEIFYQKKDSSNGLLTDKHEKWLIINPGTSGKAGQFIKDYAEKPGLCQNAKEGLILGKWFFPVAKNPSGGGNILHAKYIFWANYNETSKTFSRANLYIGSANLSKQGFNLTPESGGNIESGVVINIENAKQNDIFARLGINPDEQIKSEDIPDEIKKEKENHNSFPPPPPISYCILKNNPIKLSWEWTNSEERYKYDNVTINGQNISKEDTGIEVKQSDQFKDGASIIASVNSEEKSWIVPVFTEDGRFFVPPPKKISEIEIIDELLNFTGHIEDNDTENSDGDDSPDDNEKGNETKSSIILEEKNQYNKYPLHFATSLIETIARQNQKIADSEMEAWCKQLKNTLIGQLNEETKNNLISLGFDFLENNFFEILREEEAFAPQNNSEIYKYTINDIRDNWKSIKNTDNTKI